MQYKSSPSTIKGEGSLGFSDQFCNSSTIEVLLNKTFHLINAFALKILFPCISHDETKQMSMFNPYFESLSILWLKYDYKTLNRMIDDP